MHQGPKQVEQSNMRELDTVLPIKPDKTYTQLAWQMSRQLKRVVTKGQVAKAYYNRKHRSDGQASQLDRVSIAHETKTRRL